MPKQTWNDAAAVAPVTVALLDSSPPFSPPVPDFAHSVFRATVTTNKRGKPGVADRLEADIVFLFTPPAGSVGFSLQGWERPALRRGPVFEWQEWRACGPACSLAEPGSELLHGPGETATVTDSRRLALGD
ncbi:hypothetical protein DPEC_G00057230 [Dallia pectoralis]|uniref:Uncharacterized protein n=1 Tax=Dallia pectoralis TaxID=75939 RepID=A0ACC2H5T4_DALPE|nr:hypothetical protein DPEC_G00057230 [Dallia pectoralis]